MNKDTTTIHRYLQIDKQAVKQLKDNLTEKQLKELSSGYRVLKDIPMVDLKEFSTIREYMNYVISRDTRVEFKQGSYNYDKRVFNIDIKLEKSLMNYDKTKADYLLKHIEQHNNTFKDYENILKSALNELFDTKETYNKKKDCLDTYYKHLRYYPLNNLVYTLNHNQYNDAFPSLKAIENILISNCDLCKLIFNLKQDVINLKMVA